MRILITGASGYLGANLALYLRRQHPSAELFLGSRSGNCPWLEGLGTQVAMDFDNNDCLSNLPKVDTVVHLAAANEIECVDVTRALDVNVTKTWRLIEGLSKQSAKNFIYGSTIHAYGELSGHLVETEKSTPKHPYGFSHQMAEQLFQYAAQTLGVKVTCLRFSNIVGAPVDGRVNRWSLLVNDLCQQAARNNLLEIKTPDSQRDFIALRDACSAINWALKAGPSGFSIYNISSGTCMTVLEMAELVASRAEIIFGIEIPIKCAEPKYVPAPKSFIIDNSAAVKWGWLPSNDLVQEIDATLRLCEGLCHE
jgi:UDP-glucose 4-epimerase